MTSHAKKTLGLWDAFNPSLLITRGDIRKSTPMYPVDPYEMPDLCQKCRENFLESDGHCPECDE